MLHFMDMARTNYLNYNIVIVLSKSNKCTYNFGKRIILEVLKNNVKSF